MALDRLGNLFIADTGDNSIRKVDANGIITTVAVDSETSIGFQPNGVAVDGAGDLFVADDEFQLVLEVTNYGPSLVLDAVTAANAGNYDVVVTSPFGSVTSSVVTLTVTVPLSLLINGGSGNSVILQATGAPGQTYVLESASSLVAPAVWQPVYTNVANASGAWSFTNAALSAQPSAFYRLAVP